jgi:hypothetical protein
MGYYLFSPNEETNSRTSFGKVLEGNKETYIEMISHCLLIMRDGESFISVFHYNLCHAKGV